MYKFLIKNENETLAFAKEFASKLNKSDIVILTGDLGAGKTKFTEGFLSYYGLEKEISSPTFTIVNEYLKNDTNIYHFDVYRLEDLDEFYAIGGDEYFDKRYFTYRMGWNNWRNTPTKLYKNYNWKRYRKYKLALF